MCVYSIVLANFNHGRVVGSVPAVFRDSLRNHRAGRTENCMSVGRGFGTVWCEVVASSLGEWSQGGNAHCCRVMLCHVVSCRVVSCRVFVH